MKVSGKFNTPATSPLEKETPVPTEKQAGWAVHQVWILVKRDKILCPSQESNHDSSGIQFIAYSLHQLHYPRSILK